MSCFQEAECRFRWCKTTYSLSKLAKSTYFNLQWVGSFQYFLEKAQKKYLGKSFFIIPNLPSLYKERDVRTKNGEGLQNMETQHSLCCEDFEAYTRLLLLIGTL